MKFIHPSDDLQAIKNGTKPAVFLFSADWCPDCLYLNPFLDSIEAANPELDFYKLDRDEMMDEAIAQQIRGIPSFTVYKDGKEIGRFVNGDRKTPEQIQEFLNPLKEA